jgi:hypothetical protein
VKTILLIVASIVALLSWAAEGGNYKILDSLPKNRGAVIYKAVRLHIRSVTVQGFHREVKRRGQIDSGGRWRYAVTRWRIIENDTERALALEITYPRSVKLDCTRSLRRLLASIRQHEQDHTRLSILEFNKTVLDDKLTASEKIFRANYLFDRRTRNGRQGL